jgi:probable rRNA maturation factor
MAPGERRASVVGLGSSPTTPARVPHVRVLVADERGRRLSAFGLTRWLAQVAPARARGTVSIALVSDARSRALNKRYRRVDRPTDVLSFPASARGQSRRASARRPAEANPESPIPNPLLGDIVIARGVASRQAREAGHSELTELRVLALHGLLHLLGYDHDRDNGRMRRLEGRLRLKGGLREGLIERVDT